MVCIACCTLSRLRYEEWGSGNQQFWFIAVKDSEKTILHYWDVVSTFFGEMTEKWTACGCEYAHHLMHNILCSMLENPNAHEAWKTHRHHVHEPWIAWYEGWWSRMKLDEVWGNREGKFVMEIETIVYQILMSSFSTFVGYHCILWRKSWKTY
jgi:hypothetical protein